MLMCSCSCRFTESQVEHPPAVGTPICIWLVKFLRLLVPSTSRPAQWLPATSAQAATDEQTLCVVSSTQCSNFHSCRFVHSLPHLVLPTSLSLHDNLHPPVLCGMILSLPSLRRHLISICPLQRVWDSALSFNFEIGLLLVTAWPIPSALWAGPTGAAWYNQLSRAINSKYTKTMSRM